MILDELVVKIRADVSGIASGIQSASKQLQAFGKQMGDVGKKLTQRVTLPILGLGAASAKMATTFEANMAKIQNLVGVTGKDLEDLRKGALALAPKVGQGPNALAEALFTVTSAGLSGADALEVVEQAAKASAIGMGETETVAKAITGVMASYADAGMTAQRANEILTATVRAGNLEAASLAPVLGRVTAEASIMGVSFEQVGASLATFTRLGGEASEGVTGLKAMMKGLAKPMDDAEKAADEMGTSFIEIRKNIRENGLQAALADLYKAAEGDATMLFRLFESAEAAGMIMKTAGVQGADYADILDDISNSAGIVDDGFKSVAETAEYKFNSALAQLQVTGVKIGASLLPMLTSLAEKVSNVAKAFSDADPFIQKVVLGFAAAVAVLGPLMSITGRFIMVLPELTKVLRILFTTGLGPVGVALAGIAAVITAGISIWAAHKKEVDDLTDAHGRLAAAVASGASAYSVLDNKQRADLRENLAEERRGIRAELRELDAKIAPLEGLGSFAGTDDLKNERTRLVQRLRTLSTLDRALDPLPEDEPPPAVVPPPPPPPPSNGESIAAWRERVHAQAALNAAMEKGGGIQKAATAQAVAANEEQAYALRTLSAETIAAAQTQDALYSEELTGRIDQFAAAAQHAGDVFNQAFTTGISNLVHGLITAQIKFENLGQAMVDTFKQVVAQIAAAIVQQRILNSLTAGGGGILSALPGVGLILGASALLGGVLGGFDSGGGSSTYRSANTYAPVSSAQQVNINLRSTAVAGGDILFSAEETSAIRNRVGA